MNNDEFMTLAKRCIRCGFCLEACPTYKVTGMESNSPRGRIRLMSQVMGHGMTPTPDLVRSIDLCLGCRACETACPSGVRYGHMLEIFRAHLESLGSRPTPQRAAKETLISVMRQPEAFATSLNASHLARRFKVADPVPRPLAAALTGRPEARPLLPSLPPRPSVASLPPFSPALGARQHTVCLLQGCVMRVLYDRVNRATIRMLQRAGCDVLCPPELGCCGALDVHAGLREQGRDAARRFLATLASLNFDYLVSNSAGCGSTLKEYGELLRDDPVWAATAKRLSECVCDVTEFLVQANLPPPNAHLQAKVTYHDACHLAHAQGIRDAPRQLLARVPGITLVPLNESDMCCGSAGIYNMTQPEMARILLERKVDNIVATDADIVAMGNPGCMAWIEAGLRQRNAAIQVLHVVEILDSGYSDSLSYAATS